MLLPSLSPDWQISLGDASELLRPTLFVISTLLSALLLADARRVGLGAAASAAWTLAAFLFPIVVVPLYLAARLHTPPRSATDVAGGQTKDGTAVDDQGGDKSSPGDETNSGEESDPGGDSNSGGEPTFRQPRFYQFLRTAAPPALCAAALLALGGLYFNRDARSADAHLARANRAKLSDRREEAAREYRAALRLEDDAHTRKLLGLELAEAGRWEEALEEFRAAAERADPEEALAFHTARALEALGRGAEARPFYRQFLQSLPCLETPPPAPCEAARARLDAPGGATTGP